MLFWICGVTLLFATILGGGTHSGFCGDVVVQFLAIPLLVAALAPAFAGDHTRRQLARLALAVCLVCAAVIVLQIVPLPVDIWSGGKPLFSVSDSSSFAVPKSSWGTLSITPQATWAVAASLIVPLSVFASVLQLGLRQRMALCWLVLGLGAVSLLLGFLQMTQGQGSALRFYEFTNPTEAVGFFANRNHFAAFLNVTLILSVLWFYPMIEASLEDRTLKTRSILWFFAAAAFLVVTVAGLATARSRAGVFLAMVALAGIVMMVLLQSRSQHGDADPRHRRRTRRVSLAVALFAALFAVQVGLGRVLTRFEDQVSDDLRIPLAITTVETALKALPFGTGLGSFVSVYAAAEKTENVLVPYANRAHNDLAEILLETGLVGAVLLIVFLAWFGRTTIAVWMRSPAEGAASQALLQRASTLIIAVLLLHSLVDYPLRTTALSAIFAFFCAGLLAPVEASAPEGPKPERHSRRPPPSVTAGLSGATQSPDMDWPEILAKKRPPLGEKMYTYNACPNLWNRRCLFCRSRIRVMLHSTAIFSGDI